jgi:hypothetical protein
VLLYIVVNFYAAVTEDLVAGEDTATIPPGTLTSKFNFRCHYGQFMAATEALVAQERQTDSASCIQWKAAEIDQI